MDEFDHIRNSAKEIFIRKSFVYLKQLFKRKKLKILSTFPTINGIDCEIRKSKKDRYFKFQAEGRNKSVSPVQFQSVGYGYHNPFKLTDNLSVYDIKNGAGASNVKIFQNFKVTGELWEIESNFTKEKSYFRATFPLGKFHKLPLEYIESSSFRVGNSFRGAGLVTLNIQNSTVLLYDYNYEKTRYLFIETEAQFNCEEFEKIIESIIYCFGIVSGYLVRDEVYILKSNDPKFEKIDGFQIRKIEDSLKGIQAISPRDHKDFDKTLTKKQFLSEAVFSNLIQQCLNDSRLLRAIRIITESFEYPFEIQAATYSVSLETIKNIIIEKNEEKINPFKNKKIAGQVIADLKKQINLVDISNFNSKETVLNKIEQLNQIGNTDSFFTMFQLLTIDLNADDERCITKRNDFLHGRIPFENEAEDYKKNELKHIVYKYHFLLCAAILKNAGFSGYLMNNLRFAGELQLKKKIEEPFFRKI